MSIIATVRTRITDECNSDSRQIMQRKPWRTAIRASADSLRDGGGGRAIQFSNSAVELRISS
jgi:hypothetical protein